MQTKPNGLSRIHFVIINYYYELKFVMIVGITIYKSALRGVVCLFRYNQLLVRAVICCDGYDEIPLLLIKVRPNVYICSWLPILHSSIAVVNQLCFKRLSVSESTKYLQIFV